MTEKTANQTDVLLQLLEDHSQWLQTTGRRGKRLEIDAVDLRGIDLEGLDLSEAVLTDCTLDGKAIIQNKFSVSELYSCSFRDCQFSLCDFYKAVIDYADFACVLFESCRFSKAEVYKTSLQKSTFRDCSFVATGLYDCDLSGSLFENIDLQDSYFDNVCLSGCRFKSIRNLNMIAKMKINVGSREQSHILEGQQALEWIILRTEGGLDR